MTSPWVRWWKERSNAWWAGAIGGFLIVIMVGAFLEMYFRVRFYGAGLGFLGVFGGGAIGDRIAVFMQGPRGVTVKGQIGTALMIFGVGIVVLVLPIALRYVFQESDTFDANYALIAAVGAMMITGGWFLRQSAKRG